MRNTLPTGLLVVFICFVFLSAIPVGKTLITRMDPSHGNVLLIQDGNAQVLVAGGKDTSVLRVLPNYMPWFDRRIELVIVPTYFEEDIASIVALLDRYDVGAVLLPTSNTTSDSGKLLIGQILARHIPYRFAQYGERITAGRITLRIMASDPIALRVDAGSMSMIVLGDASVKTQQQLLGSVPTEAFPAKIIYAEKHGTKPPSIVPGLLYAISPKISFSDLPYDATLAFQRNSWFMKCVHETDLPFLQHYCMNK